MKSEPHTKWKERDCEINQEILCELFDYDKETGVVTSKAGVQGRTPGPVGSLVSLSGGLQYYRIKVCYREIFLHRAIWMMETGEWPDQIDHINGDGLDNRWVNLRNVDTKKNAQNQSLAINNKTGIIGVRWRSDYGRWVAQIMVDGQSIHLYWGYDLFEACCRRKSAEAKYGFHENHGSR